MNLKINLKTDGFALAEVESATDKHVVLKIDGTDKWDADGLLKLSALLKGVAAILTASVLVLFSVGADAQDLSDWHKWVRFDAAEAGRTFEP